MYSCGYQLGGIEMIYKNKSFKLYQLYNDNKLPENIKSRCCNFKLLEEKCLEYK